MYGLWSGYELIMNYIPFEVNTKKLMNSLAGVLEKEAVSEENFLQTQELLTKIEKTSII